MSDMRRIGLKSLFRLSLLSILFLTSGALLLVPVTTGLAVGLGPGWGWAAFCLMGVLVSYLVAPIAHRTRLKAEDRMRLEDWLHRRLSFVRQDGAVKLWLVGFYLGPVVAPFAYALLNLELEQNRKLTILSSILHCTIFYIGYGLGGYALLQGLL